VFAHRPYGACGDGVAGLLATHLSNASMKKNHFMLSNMERILDALTRGRIWTCGSIPDV
jgi:hypothetical protein